MFIVKIHIIYCNRKEGASVVQLVVEGTTYMQLYTGSSPIGIDHHEVWI